VNIKLDVSSVLVVDDTASNIDILGEVLSDYKVIIAMTGEDALKKAASKNKPDIILLDVMMPEMDGYEVCRKLKDMPETRDIPVIFITSKSDPQDETFGLTLGAVDYITKPISPTVVKARVKTHLSLKLAKEALRDQNCQLEEMVRERTHELEITKNATIQSLASLAETRDNETGNHIRRTQNYVKVMAEKLAEHPLYRKQLDAKYIDLFYKSAPLHDIGKVGVPDRILLKPGKLTDEEMDIMKQHTVCGYEALLVTEEDFGNNSFLQIARDIALSHHEKWDGSGYPNGLKENQIPLSGRLMAFADIYDALISKRVYKPAYTHAEAVRIITEGDGRTRPEHFDPLLLEVFKDITETFRLIASNYSDQK